MWIGHRKEIWKLNFLALTLYLSVNPSSEWIKELWVVCGCVVVCGLDEWKEFVDTVRIKSADSAFECFFNVGRGHRLLYGA